MRPRGGFSGRPLLGQLGVALVIIAVLAVGKAVFLPFALAVLAATLLGPIVSRWEGWIGRPAASLSALALMVAIVSSGLVFAGAQVAAIAEELPQYSANVSRKLGELRLRNSTTFAQLEDAVRDLARKLEEAPLDAPLVRVAPQADSLTTRLAPVGFVLEHAVTALLVVTLVFFLLLHAQMVNDKIRRLFGRANVAATSGALRKASQRVGRYLLLQTIANAATGSLVGGALFALGVPHAALFGLLTAILRFVPYIGTTLAALLPTALAFAVSPGWVLPLLTFASILTIDAAFGLVVEPLWFGRRMGVSPIMLPLSAMVWTWIWGPIGLILATPIAVSLQVIGETVPSLGFLDVIFGVGSKLDPHLQFLGRLLARNKEAAVELAARIEVEGGLEALYEQVLMPALAELETARAELRIDAGSAREAVDATRAIIAAAGPFEQHPFGIRVLLASPGAADDPGALMTGQMLRSLGHDVSYLQAEPAIDEVVSFADAVHAQVLVVSSSRPSQVAAATEVVNRIQAERPHLGIIVIGRGPADAATRFLDLGCSVARNLATVGYLVPHMAERSGKAEFSRPAPKSPRGARAPFDAPDPVPA